MKKYMHFENCFNPVNDIFRDFKQHARHYDNLKKRHIILPPKNQNVPCVLLVAHLDTVQAPVITHSDKNIFYGAGFDDRSGLYLAMRAYYSDAQNIAVLLTDNEEIGATTATYAADELAALDIALLVGLDRAGNDYVTYDYESDACNALLGTLGVVRGLGSYSDICALYALGVTGINLGIGYTLAHSRKSAQSKLGLVSALALVLAITSTLHETGEIMLDDVQDDEYDEYMCKREEYYY